MARKVASVPKRPASGLKAAPEHVRAAQPKPVLKPIPTMTPDERHRALLARARMEKWVAERDLAKALHALLLARLDPEGKLAAYLADAGKAEQAFREELRSYEALIDNVKKKWHLESEFEFDPESGVITTGAGPEKE